jgi:hypothetical protein
MLKLQFVAGILIALFTGQCTKNLAVSDFCKQIETIGYERMLTKFSADELMAINGNRKRALLALRRAYDEHCA